jgi:hypothetical protein
MESILLTNTGVKSAVIKKRNYSLRSEFTGFDDAALID